MNFLKTTLLNGLFMLLPILLLWIGLREIAELLAAMAEPIADLLPNRFFEDLHWPGIVAALLIAAVSLLLGLAALVPPLAFVGNKLESTILFRVPMYKMLKIFSSSLISVEGGGVYAAILKGDDGTCDPCYVVELHEGGMATVLLPWSPTSFAGSVKIVPVARLERVNCSIDQYSRSISLMGVGLEECIRGTPAEPDR